MSEKKNMKSPEAVEEPVLIEDRYMVEDLVAASRKLFRVPPECVVAALKGDDRKEMTVNEAKAVLTEFMNKEVK